MTIDNDKRQCKVNRLGRNYPRIEINMDFANFVIMRIPAEKVEIPAEKITDYLLMQKEKNDKSDFLSKLGYTIQNWKELEQDIRLLVVNNSAHIQRRSPFGDI